MTRVLISLTARQLLGRRRILVISLVLVLPLLIAVLYRFSEESDQDFTSQQFALDHVGALITTVLLPLVALVLGTAALGAEIEDGTAVFLLTKPIERWHIITVKIGVATAGTVLLVVPVSMATTWIVHESPTKDGLMFGLGLGAAVAALLYCAVFVALSAVTNRALIVGLIYVFVWEAFASLLFNALRWVSIREYASGWSDTVISIADTSVYDPQLSVASAIIGSIVVLGAAVAYGTHALSRFESGERS